MRILLLILIPFLVSCTRQEKTATIASNNNEKMVSTNFITFNDWYISTVKTVKSQTQLEDFEKKNILNAIEDVSEDKFKLLQQYSKALRGNENFEEIYVIHYSEGEVVSLSLNYFFSDGINAKKVILGFNSNKTNLMKPSTIPLLTFTNIDTYPFNSENMVQDIVLLTYVKDKNVKSKCGNPNNNLVKVLDE